MESQSNPNHEYQETLLVGLKNSAIFDKVQQSQLQPAGFYKLASETTRHLDIHFRIKIKMSYTASNYKKLKEITDKSQSELFYTLVAQWLLEIITEYRLFEKDDMWNSVYRSFFYAINIVFELGIDVEACVKMAVPEDENGDLGI